MSSSGCYKRQAGCSPRVLTPPSSRRRDQPSWVSPGCSGSHREKQNGRSLPKKSTGTSASCVHLPQNSRWRDRVPLLPPPLQDRVRHPPAARLQRLPLRVSLRLQQPLRRQLRRSTSNRLLPESPIAPQATSPSTSLRGEEWRPTLRGLLRRSSPTATVGKRRPSLWLPQTSAFSSVVSASCTSWLEEAAFAAANGAGKFKCCSSLENTGAYFVLLFHFRGGNTNPETPDPETPPAAVEPELLPRGSPSGSVTSPIRAGLPPPEETSPGSPPSTSSPLASGGGPPLLNHTESSATTSKREDLSGGSKTELELDLLNNPLMS